LAPQPAQEPARQERRSQAENKQSCLLKLSLSLL
jgi:hypothetical protein